ncbi:MAG: hypothetical protein EB102_04355, partial [Gammaproteobacteria bacterium]|nr:hypothetical protein [Gammaproteobacteria bacterium]
LELFDTRRQSIELALLVERQLAALDARVAEPAFYGRPHDEVRETLRLLQAMASDIEVAYARWAELESRQSTAS